MPNGERPNSAAAPDLDLTPDERLALYAARRYLGLDLEKKFEIRIKFDVYYQDPGVAAKNPELGIDKDFLRALGAGSGGRSDLSTLRRGGLQCRCGHADAAGKMGRQAERALPVQTANPQGHRHRSRRQPLKDNEGIKAVKDNLQFHQVHAWAIVQNALDFYESGFGLGRKILWGFEGSRLIVVPHAGFGENAFYDRQSKSLQFYYFDRGEDRIYTCLSADIVNHEFGHAVLDGIRPYFNEATTPETAAFHEFAGDLTALLVVFRNNAFREKLGIETEGELYTQNTLTNIADEFGNAVEGRPYLRSAINDRTMQSLADDQRPHLMSEVLTGAVFEILFRLSRHYIEVRKHTVKQAFAFTIMRIQQMAIQPLDLLPPVDATFRDYAVAMLRAEEIANPTDPDNYRGMMFEIFVKRGVLNEADRDELLAVRHVFQRIDNIAVFHDAETIASSRAEAYRFLDDNRDALFIPRYADVTVADLFTAQKLTREGTPATEADRAAICLAGGCRAGRQTIRQLQRSADQYVVRRNAGARPERQCHGLDTQARLGARRPRRQGGRASRRKVPAAGQRYSSRSPSGSKPGALAKRCESPKGMVGGKIAPFIARTVDGGLRFELSPHFGIQSDEDDEMGSRQWQISS